MFSHPSFLRRVLIADAVSSAGMGAALLLAAGYVDEMLGLPPAFLESAGLALLPFAGFVLYVATRPSLSRAAVRLVVVLNAIWVVDSLLVFVTGWLAPTVLGAGFIIAQAIFVGVLAELEYFGLRRSIKAMA
jgi:hypothetical protein